MFDFDNSPYILNYVYLQGSTMKSLVKLLKITLAGSDKETLNEEINNKLFDHIMGGVEAVSGKFGHYYIGVSQQPKSVLPIKGTVSLYFLHLFFGSTWAQHDQATTVWRTFCCHEDIRSLKIAYPRSQRLRCHFVRVVANLDAKTKNFAKPF